MSTDNLREQRLKHVTGLATRMARNQINETTTVFAPIAFEDEELRDAMWAAYIGHVAGRLAAMLGRTRTLAIMNAVLTHEDSHDH